MALREVRERHHHFLSQSRGTLAHVGEQIRASGSILLLTDAEGIILEGSPDPHCASLAEQAALVPGASWHEKQRGTNAIGTAIAESTPIEILGGEHFFDCNAFLSSCAAPVHDPIGRLIGIIALSGHFGAHQNHTLGLARLTAQMLERRLFEAEHRDNVLLALHAEAESIGTLQDGLLAFSPDGDLLGANPAALQMLCQQRARLRQLNFELLFAMPFGQFMDRAGNDRHALIALPHREGGSFYSQLIHRDRSVWPASTARKEPAVVSGHAGRRRATDRSLDALDTGDPDLALAISRAKRIAGKDIPLLVLGESGVGKELFAKAFHASGPRRSGPFVALNCAAIPENLIESELFGYVGGAFTGARREGYMGKIQQASGGTLFLDEIGDMHLNLQARLLRVLQERMVTPLGGATAIRVDISLVCATHRQLLAAVKDGHFRQDLYYRVNGLSVTVPPLRRRRDIRQIAETLLHHEIQDGRRITLSEAVLELFGRYSWPGNVRQMQNVLRVALALLEDGCDCITPECLPEELLSGVETCAEPDGPIAGPAPVAGHSPLTLDQIEAQMVESVLAKCNGNISAAARTLGISRNTLYRKLSRLA